MLSPPSMGTRTTSNLDHTDLCWKGPDNPRRRGGDCHPGDRTRTYFPPRLLRGTYLFVVRTHLMSVWCLDRQNSTPFPRTEFRSNHHRCPVHKRYRELRNVGFLFSVKDRFDLFSTPDPVPTLLFRLLQGRTGLVRRPCRGT